MKKEEIKKKIDSLIEKINDADYKYYVLADPDIDDYHYDMLVKELEELEQKYPELKREDSPTIRVSGEPTKEFHIVEHIVPMLSLTNSYNIKDLYDFDKRVKTFLRNQKYEYVCELKFDGIAVSLTYVNGKLQLGATRGDGLKGDDITQNLKTIKSIPLYVKDSKIKNFEVRGEVFIKKDDFKKINDEQREKGLKIFANARNTAAGTLKLKDHQLVFKRPLNIFCYYLRTDDIERTSHFQNLKILEKLKFPVCSKFVRKFSSIDEVKKFCDEVEVLRETLPYEIDGVVIKIDSLAQQEIIGSVSKSPRWAIAYKFKALSGTTRIKDITLQVGRVGTITPVAELEPIFLAGSTISRASLYNFEEIKRKDIRVGDWVKIEKGGDVIPKVTEVIMDKRDKNSLEYEIPDKCPVCNGKLVNPKDEVNYYCTNYSCPSQVQGRIEHFVSRNAMEIDGLGESIISLFIEKKYIKDYADIYLLKNYKNELVNMERFGEKSVENILNAIEKSKEKPFEKVLYAIGIRHVGERTAKILAKHFKNIDNLHKATLEEVEDIYEIGPTVADSIIQFFKNEKNIKLINRLKEAGLKFKIAKDANAQINENIKDKVFVLTGTLEKYTRDKAKEVIENLGGRVSTSVSSKTDFLLAGEEAGSKLKKAKDLGVKIISEEEFEKMIK